MNLHECVRKLKDVKNKRGNQKVSLSEKVSLSLSFSLSLSLLERVLGRDREKRKKKRRWRKHEFLFQCRFLISFFSLFLPRKKESELANVFLSIIPLSIFSLFLSFKRGFRKRKRNRLGCGKGKSVEKMERKSERRKRVKEEREREEKE